MKTITRFSLGCLLCGLAFTSHAASSTILGWNNLGMHCMDSDYSVFSILPPYNTIEGQLIVGGKLVTNGAGYTVTYQAIADPAGSSNRTSFGKSNFYTYVQDLYPPFVPVATDVGLAGWDMPGPANIPQTNLFQTLNEPVHKVFTPVNWFHAEGIPITPYDDAGQKNPYPLMRMIARNSNYQPIATNDVVLPVSDEMDCRACHASGTQDAAKPAAGWIWDGLPERDYRLNILRLHDERQFAEHGAVYVGALAANNYNPAGLYRRVTADGKPVLCALCHASEALQTDGYPGVPPLTASVHSFHAHVMDPVTNTNLDSAVNRSACYRCHPGSTTRCLRGAMGSAIAADGSMEMQCQSCHGNMSAVGSSSRVGWIMEPNCQGCHTGTASTNSGQIRYTSAVIDTNGTMRVPADRTFATTTDIPAPGLSLYRFSIGHGGLQCSACHGSTHAEFPSSHVNDNVRNIALQGHAGVLSECTACHTSMPTNSASGPHGMHPVGQTWVSRHHKGISEGPMPNQCKPCHGTDGRGTVLSRMLADRTLNLDDAGTQTFFRGAIIGCYTCHNGSGNGDPNPNPAPNVTGVVTNTTNDKSVDILLPITGASAYPRIISQAANGSVGVNTNTHVATYFPNPGFVGTDQFTFAAYDYAKNSNLATGTVSVAQGPFSIGAVAHVPPTYPAAWPVAFAVVPTVTNSAAAVAFDWNFGDGSVHSTNQYAAHAYALPGTYNWSVTSTVSTASTTTTGTIVIGNPVQLGIASVGGLVTLSWPNTIADTILEGSTVLGPSAQWQWITNTPTASPGVISLVLPAAGTEFLRLRRPW
jgi:PKD repeat protein